jgi:hypothetical protein
MKNQPLAGSSLRACFLCDLGGFSLRALGQEFLTAKFAKDVAKDAKKNPTALHRRDDAR